ncbi:hypothetical protein BH20VER1_BH20VER1_01950 [soil metagenome]
MTRASSWGIGIGIVAFVSFAAAVALVVYLIADANRGQRLLAQAYEEVQLGNCNRAIALYDEALQTRLTPYSASYAHGNRAHCYQLVGQPAAAWRDVEAALRLNPEFAWAYQARGLLHEESGDTAQALADYSEALRRDPNIAESLVRRAKIFLQRQDTASAIRDYKEAVRVLPGRADLHVALSEAQVQHGDAASAVASLESAIRIDPFYPDSYKKRAEIHRLMDRGMEAAADESRAQQAALVSRRISHRSPEASSESSTGRLRSSCGRSRWRRTSRNCASECRSGSAFIAQGNPFA